MNRKKLLIATTLASTLACGSAMAEADRMSDTWKEASITTAYTLNEHLNPFAIDIEVRDRTAYLQGEVESEVDRELAEQIALGTDGVDKVENNLVVVRDARSSNDGDSEPDFARVVNDSTVTARVKSQLLWNQNTSGLNINVSTNNRVVTLAGTVGSEAERSLVQVITRNTKGVREVKSELAVGPSDNLEESAKDVASAAGQAVSDSWITTKVKSVLLFNRGVDGTDIHVKTNDGVVTLSGRVQGDAEGQRAVSIASGVVGVKSVRAAW